MLNLIFGIEDSFIKSLVYVIILAAVIIMSGSLIYVAIVGLSMYLNKFAFGNRAGSKSENQNNIAES